MINISNLNKTYRQGNNKIHVINNTNVSFNNTGLVCILGESGSGKTTLMNAIGGLDKYDSGEINIDNVKINRYNASQIDKVRNEHFGYIFQNYYLLQDRTVYYNIELALNMYNLDNDAKEERIQYVLKSVGMEKYGKRKISQLSGGQQQRVAIARALAKTPNVIFADEPTGNLDEKNTIQIMNIIKKVSKECLVILVTHEKNIAKFYADRIIKIEDGKISEDFEVTSRDEYRFEDDHNIYLKDMNNIKSFNSDETNIRVYDDGSLQSNKIDLNVIVKNGRIIIDSNNSDLKVEVLDRNDERKVIDGHQQTMTIDKVEDFEYNLESLQTKKAPRLGFKETLRLAWNNLKSRSKKNIFMYLALFATAVSTTIATADILSLINYNGLHQCENYSPNAYELAINGFGDEVKEIFATNMKEMNTDENYCVDFHPDISTATFKLVTNDFVQLSGSYLDFSIKNVMDIKYLDESKLICGRMPKYSNEVVLNKELVYNAINSNSLLTSFYPTIESVLNSSFTTRGTFFKLNGRQGIYTIVGICDTKDVTCFCRAETICSFGNSLGLSIITISEAKECYPELYGNVTLPSGHVIIGESALRMVWPTTSISGLTSFSIASVPYTVDNTQNKDTADEYMLEIPDQHFENVVIADEDINKILIDEAFRNSKAMVYSYNNIPENAKKACKRMGNDEVIGNYMGEGRSLYTICIEKYKTNIRKQMKLKVTICVALLVVSVFAIYFTMKTNAVRRIYDIGVYRSIGISKFSICGSFIIETIIVSLFTTLIGSLLSYGLCSFLSSIPLINLNIGMSVGALVVSVLCLFAFNIVVSLLPVFRLLHLTPAQLTSKYDI